MHYLLLLYQQSILLRFSMDDSYSVEPFQTRQTLFMASQKLVSLPHDSFHVDFQAMRQSHHKYTGETLRMIV